MNTHVNTRMNSNTPGTRTRPTYVAGDSVLSFQANPGERLVCSHGHLWVTQDGDPRDVFVGPGENFLFDRRGTVVVHALHAPGAFVVTGARRAQAGWIAWLVAAIRARLRARSNTPAPVSSVTGRTVRGRLAQTVG